MTARSGSGPARATGCPGRHIASQHWTRSDKRDLLADRSPPIHHDNCRERESNVVIRLVSWNINRQTTPWHCLVKMAQRGEADVALLQEAGSPPDDLVERLRYEDAVYWSRSLYDRWPLIVQLSDRVEIDWFSQVPQWGDIGQTEVGTSGIGIMAAARVAPRGRPQDAFIAVSMYARWMRAHPSTGTRPGDHADVSAHRILSDIQAFIDYAHPSRYRILAAGDLNLVYTPSG